MLSSRGLCVPTAPPFARLRAALRAAAARLAEIRHAVEGRRALARMDGRMLADIGISRAEALLEINRRPWDTCPFQAQQPMRQTIIVTKPDVLKTPARR